MRIPIVVAALVSLVAAACGPLLPDNDWTTFPGPYDADEIERVVGTYEPVACPGKSGPPGAERYVVHMEKDHGQLAVYRFEDGAKDYDRNQNTIQRGDTVYLTAGYLEANGRAAPRVTVYEFGPEGGKITDYEGKVTYTPEPLYPDPGHELHDLNFTYQSAETSGLVPTSEVCLAKVSPTP